MYNEKMSPTTTTNLARLCITLFLCSWNANADSSNNIGVFNVKRYGAVPDGRTDSTNAFRKVWSEACAVPGGAKILIPAGTFYVGPLTFKGPCKGSIEVQLDGVLLATKNLGAYANNWVDIQYVNGLTISGKGTLDGQGAATWPLNQCPKNWNCRTPPMNLVLSFVNDAYISGITSLNSKFFHMHVFSCKNVHISSVTITAPGDSPNTDGIHLGDSTGVTITDSIIGTGDDCISIGPNNIDVTITGVTCGPGHGISIGSLGKNKNEGDVANLLVKSCTIKDTTNGLRIKTWESSPIATKAYNFTFEDIVMNNVANPIIIDQKYCPYTACTATSPSRVKISGIRFINIRGTSATPVALNFVCSDAHPCEGIELKDVVLVYKGLLAAETTASCTNVRGISNGNVKPGMCI